MVGAEQLSHVFSPRVRVGLGSRLEHLGDRLSTTLARWEGRALLERYGVRSRTLLDEAWSSPTYHGLRRHILRQSLLPDQREALLLDSATYVARGEAKKVGLMHALLADGQTQPTVLDQALPILRQLPDDEIILPDAMTPGRSGLRRSVALMQDKLGAQGQRFVLPQLGGALTRFTKQYGSALASAAEGLFAELAIPIRSRTIVVGEAEKAAAIKVVVPHDFLAFRRQHGIVREPFFSGMAHYVADTLTRRLPLVAVEDRLTRVLKSAYNLDADELQVAAERERGISRRLWDFVLNKVGDDPQGKYLMWLNESTTPRYFGRDQVEPAFAKRIGMVQHLDDRGAWEFLREHRPELRSMARTMRHGERLSNTQKAFRREVKEHFGVKKNIRLLPIHEVKMKSGHNDHQIEKTAPVLDDLIDLAELLGMQILFTDISSNPVGRSQRYVKAFMESRGIPTRPEGRLIAGFAQETPEDSMVNDAPIAEAFAGAPPDEDRSGSRVEVVQFDPNEEGLTASVDDAKWLTVRNRIAKSGLYVPTRVPAIIPRLGGLVSAEDYWRELLVPPVITMLQAGQDRRPMVAV